MFYPINLNIKNFKVVIIGGGQVAYRKCKNFLDFNCRVKVISPKFCNEFYLLGSNVELVEDYYNEEYIKDYSIIVAATNDKEVNKGIGEYCILNNKLVNVVDNIELSNYTVPSYIKKGDLLISVSTGGKSPSLSKKIKLQLEKYYDDTYEEYINLLGEIREIIILRYGNDIDKRKDIIKSLVDLSLDELKEEKKKYIKNEK